MAEPRNRDTAMLKLSQAREALEDAKTLLVQDAEVNFVMNSLYYAFLYAVLGLLHVKGISAPMQSTAISLFEREFVQSRQVEGRFLLAVRRAFELRPACSCEGQKQATPQDVEQLLPVADEFLDSVRKIVEKNN